MQSILIFLITHLYTALASFVQDQDQSTNMAGFSSTDSSAQVDSWDLGDLAPLEDLGAAKSPFIPLPASPSIPFNPALSPGSSIPATPFIAANPSDSSTFSDQKTPSDKTSLSNSVQGASFGKPKSSCSPGGTQTPGKVRRGDVCTYSWEDDPTSREDFICPIEFYLVCCLGPVRNLIYTLQCIHCKRSFLCLCCSPLVNEILRSSD